MNNTQSQSQVSRQGLSRILRAPRWLSVLAILCFGGPLNPAVWAIGLSVPENPFFDVNDRLYLFLMIPSTVMTMATLVIISKRVDLLDGIAWPVCLGFVVALALSPFTTALGGAIAANAFSVGEVLQMTFVLIFLGWILGIIPYFAVTHGLPCALVLFAVLFLCSTRAEIEADAL
ncbi:MAG: hypothetical protein ACU0GG_19730 [Paracoccaceae bacterium]